MDDKFEISEDVLKAFALADTLRDEIDTEEHEINDENINTNDQINNEGVYVETKPIVVKKFKSFNKANELKNKKHKLIRKVPFIAGIISIALAVGILGMPYVQNNITTNDYIANHTNQEITQIVDEEQYAVNPYIYEGDVKAYIDSSIFQNVYPVVQTGDNTYYLNHNINGDVTKVGTIFKDCNNNEGLSDDLTIIYGHNLRDNSNFGKLAELADKETFMGKVHDADDTYNENKAIDYKDEYGHYNIDIFASGVYDASVITNKVGNFDSEEDFNEILELIKNNSDIETGILPQYGDKIVCFATCPDSDANDYYRHSGQNPNNRVLVFGVAKQLEKYQELPNSKSQTAHL